MRLSLHTLTAISCQRLCSHCQRMWSAWICTKTVPHYDGKLKWNTAAEVSDHYKQIGWCFSSYYFIQAIMFFFSGHDYVLQPKCHRVSACKDNNGNKFEVPLNQALQVEGDTFARGLKKWKTVSAYPPFTCFPPFHQNSFVKYWYMLYNWQQIVFWTLWFSETRLQRCVLQPLRLLNFNCSVFCTLTLTSTWSMCLVFHVNCCKFFIYMSRAQLQTPSE